MDGRRDEESGFGPHVPPPVAVSSSMDVLEPFDAVVRRHGPAILRLCRARLSGHADAEDAWSECFLAALRAYPRLPPDADVLAWLVTIAKNACVDQIRARARRPLTVDELPEPSSPPPPRDPDLWSEVAGLSTRQREAIGYHYLGGLPFSEVAEAMGGTPTAARKAASDGVRALRRARSAGADEQRNGEERV